MANVTIINGTETFTFQSGDVESVKILKQGSLDENPMPASDSDESFVIDFNGVLKTITLTGALTAATTTRVAGETVLTISAQIDWLLDLVDGAQTGYTFGSTFQTSKTVYCRKVSFDEVQGEVTKSPFTIELVEGV